MALWWVGAEGPHAMQTAVTWRVLLEGGGREGRELRREEEEKKKRKRDREGGIEEVQVQPHGNRGREGAGRAPPFYVLCSLLCREIT